MSIYLLVIAALSRAQRAFDYSDINCLSLNIFPLNPLSSINILYNDVSTFPVLMTRRICLTIVSFINRWSHPLRRNQKPVTLRVEELIMYFFKGYDMEDAMILNKSSYERGFAHGSVIKCEVCTKYEVYQSFIFLHIYRGLWIHSDYLFMF